MNKKEINNNLHQAYINIMNDYDKTPIEINNKKIIEIPELDSKNWLDFITEFEIIIEKDIWFKGKFMFDQCKNFTINQLANHINSVIIGEKNE